MGMSAHSAAPHRQNGNGRAHTAPRAPAREAPEFLECAPELVGALKGGSPRFAHVALASYLARRPEVPEADRAYLRRNFADMFERFERSSGRIVSWYMAKEVFAAAALTDKDGISVSLGRELPPGSAELVDLIRRCQQVAYSAWHRLNRFDRRQCQTMIFQVIEEALRRIDTDGAVRSEDCLGPLKDRLDQAEEFMLRCATRRAQSKYPKGMLLGTLATGAVISLVTTVLVA